MNLLHDIAPGSADKINVIIEINRGSKNKYEIDKETGVIALDRVLHSAQTFPFDYGFIPQTLWDDGDAVDVIVLATEPLPPGTLVKVRPVALMNMIDSGEADDKMLAVPLDDPRWNVVKDLTDINPHTLKEIEHFFSTYKKLQNKEVKINGFADREAAIKAFDRGSKLYLESGLPKK
ncbi:MAG: inorganic diphosphatase [Patescibacteria group bacterium]